MISPSICTRGVMRSRKKKSSSSSVTHYNSNHIPRRPFYMCIENIAGSCFERGATTVGSPFQNYRETIIRHSFDVLIVARLFSVQTSAVETNRRSLP